MALSFNKRYRNLTASERRNDIYEEVLVASRTCLTKIIHTYVDDIGAAKTIELFVGAAENPEYYDVISEEESLLRTYGLSTILTEVLAFLEGTDRQEYFENLEQEA